MTTNRMTWSKFFWDDVLRDHNLERCTYTAKGFWLHLKALSVQTEPMGYLAEGDKPMTTRDLARLSGLKKITVENLLGQLEVAGVFSRDSRGVIYCRRIVRENAARLQNKINGCAGGNPQLAAKNDEKPDNPYKLKAKQLSATQLEPPEGGGRAALVASLQTAPLIRAAQMMGTTIDALHRKLGWSVFGYTFQLWVEEGCDPERDIWPVLGALTAKRGGVPQAPAYFAEAVREARDRRLEGKPQPRTLGAPYVASTALVHAPWVSPEDQASRLATYKQTGVWPKRWGLKPVEQTTENGTQGSESASP
ncbi:MAG: hypothetical protein HOP13_12430 [Alphaproteobacteria bacterium]|nr:hypothetical protein [Alphaproteobacteria bacterium]